MNDNTGYDDAAIFLKAQPMFNMTNCRKYISKSQRVTISFSKEWPLKKEKCRKLVWQGFGESVTLLHCWWERKMI